MRYPFIHEHAAGSSSKKKSSKKEKTGTPLTSLTPPPWAVRAMCKALRVRPSGYYAWRRRHGHGGGAGAGTGKPTDREIRRLQLVQAIRAAHEQSHGAYGSPRVHRQLRKQGVNCSRKTVEKLMKQEGLRSRRARRFRPPRTTDSAHDHPIAPNTLGTLFDQAPPPSTDLAWVADITFVPTQEGWLYLAAVMDLCSRRIVGWATADHLRATLPLAALDKALAARRPPPGGVLLHHSDRGSQYAADAYRAVLKCRGVARSMSRAGNVYDNAAMESFMATFKTELVHHHDFATRKEANDAIYPFVELFYNHQRLHSALGYQSPAEYEANLP
jgi:putative transposase